MGRGESLLDAVLAVDPRHRDLAALAVIAQHRDLAAAGGRPAATFSAVSQSSACAVELGEDALSLVDVDGAGLGQGAAELGLEVGGQQAVGAEHAGRGRDQHAGDAEQGGERAAVQRAGAAERHQREVARIVAALDRDDAHGADHVVVEDRQHAARRLRRGRASRARRPRGR